MPMHQTCTKEDETWFSFHRDKLTLYPWLPNHPGKASISALDCVATPSVMNPELKSLCDKNGPYGLHCGIFPMNAEQPHDTKSASATENEAVCNSQSRETTESSLDILLSNLREEHIHAAKKLVEVLGESVKIRVKAQSELCARCLVEQMASAAWKVNKRRIKSCGHARTAVLFSGGIDSLVLAALADR